MKKCSYCGRDSALEAKNCRECGTAFDLPEDEKAGLNDKVRTVTIRLFGNHEAADIAAANLEAHGIKCWTSADDCSGAYPNLTTAGGVRLHTSAVDAEAAITLLDTPLTDAEEASLNQAATGEDSPPAEPAGKPSWGMLFLGIVIGGLLVLIYQDVEKMDKRTIYQRDKNGRPEEAWVYQGHYLKEHDIDRNGDGKWDYWAYHNEFGHIQRIEEDNNYDGKADAFWTYYANGDLYCLEEDTDFNGILDAICTYKNDVIAQMDIKPNGSTFATIREIFENGVLTEIKRGGDSEGNFKEVVRYDPFFEPISTNFNYIRLPGTP